MTLSEGVSVKDLEKEVLKFLQSRNNGWTWFFGSEKMTREETIRRFKNDKNFKKTVIDLAIKRAIDDFKAGSM
jgi:transposase